MEIASSIASMILAIVAIMMSIYFYTQSKNVETSVLSSLESIKSQTDTLQKLSGKWMDRLTKYVTDSHPNEEIYLHLFAALKDLPTNIVSQLRVPNNKEEKDELVDQLVSSYVALYYYTGLTNYWAQLSLPPLEHYDDNPDFSSLVKNIVDTSYKDFFMIENILNKIDTGVVETCSTAYLIEDAIKVWRPRVMDSTESYAQREKEGY